MPDDTTSRHKIQWLTLLAYGSGGILPIALFNIAGQLMGLIGNIGLGLSAFWLGTIMIIPRIWDAVSDPIIGHLSDTCKSRHGKRRPFILFGGIMTGISFVLMWWIPDGDWIRSIFGSESAYDWFRLSYILLWLMIFFTADTIFEIPHGALGMEMANDTHERTRLFSSKSFMGNLFAMGTPWLFFLANLEFFKGTGGNEADGMRWVSMMVAAVVIPLSLLWFRSLKEPQSNRIQASAPKRSFWKDAGITVRNKTFILLVAIFFILAMGFNFVGLLNYYISIFYLYGGDKAAAAPLLGINGTIWGVTGLLAVFPLNWISPKIGKRKTLTLSILLMCGAQLSKIFCYNPDMPYLVIIPTILLSAGMLMFFTLGPSMLGDICDEDELKTGTRSAGSYYSIYWWFIKMGTAFASFVTGTLILLSDFDEKQTTGVDDISGGIAIIKAEVEENGNWTDESFMELNNAIIDLDEHFTEIRKENPENSDHSYSRLQILREIHTELTKLDSNGPELISDLDALKAHSSELAIQSPETLFRLRAIEISLPLLLSALSLFLTFRYPLSEQRVLEIREALKERQATST